MIDVRRGGVSGCALLMFLMELLRCVVLLATVDKIHFFRGNNSLLRRDMYFKAFKAFKADHAAEVRGKQ